MYGLPSAIAGHFDGDGGKPAGQRGLSLGGDGPRYVDDGAGDLDRLGNCDLGSEALNADFRLQTLRPAISRKRLPVQVMRLISPRSGRRIFFNFSPAPRPRQRLFGRMCRQISIVSSRRWCCRLGSLGLHGQAQRRVTEVRLLHRQSGGLSRCLRQASCDHTRGNSNSDCCVESSILQSQFCRPLPSLTNRQRVAHRRLELLADHILDRSYQSSTTAWAF